MTRNVLEVLAHHTCKDVGELAKVASEYPVAVTPFLMARVKEGSYSPQALKQFLPDIMELQDSRGFVDDPTGESGLHPAPSVLQTYENRLALLLTHNCLVYCRFCFRKSFVGMPTQRILEEDVIKGLEYMRAHPECTDILLTGGDPLALSNRTLIPLLSRLTQIEHLKVIRIHSRAISVQPNRIDDELIEFLGQDDRFWYYAHMNHPDDINHPDVISAARRLIRAGVPVFNQCVLLGGVNDDPATMVKLMELCYQNKVLPYNLYVLDRVKGAAHFEVPVDRVIEVYRAIDSLPGPAQPALVYVDARSRKHRTLYNEWIDLREFLSGRENVKSSG